jgi:quercetin dioxygenase-like cupin family protein
MNSSNNIYPKGWGYEKWIVNKPEYCGKILYINKDKRVSWHYHILKDETFYVQSGKIILKYSTEDDIQKANEIILNVGDSFHIPKNLRHQMIALENTELFEFSTEHFETDSYRLIKGD